MGPNVYQVLVSRWEVLLRYWQVQVYLERPSLAFGMKDSLHF